jgi:hypothetical protein
VRLPPVICGEAPEAPLWTKPLIRAAASVAGEIDAAGGGKLGGLATKGADGAAGAGGGNSFGTTLSATTGVVVVIVDVAVIEAGKDVGVHGVRTSTGGLAGLKVEKI